MLHPVRAVLVLCLAAALSACSPGGDDGSLRKEVVDLRADLQRTQKENQMLAAQAKEQARRLEWLMDDMNRVRQIGTDVTLAPAPADGAAAAADGGPVPAGAAGGASAAQDAAILSAPEGVAIRAFLGTAEGKKVIEGAIQSEREARELDQAKRRADSMVDRFAKQANLTEDQTRRMKEIVGRQAVAMRELWSGMREMGFTAAVEQRDEMRRQNLARTEELRKETEDQVKAVLSQTQFETYEKEQDRLRAGMRGFGGGPGGGGGAGGRGGRQDGN